MLTRFALLVPRAMIVSSTPAAARAATRTPRLDLTNSSINPNSPAAIHTSSNQIPSPEERTRKMESSGPSEAFMNYFTKRSEFAADDFLLEEEETSSILTLDDVTNEESSDFDFNPTHGADVNPTHNVDVNPTQDADVNLTQDVEVNPTQDVKHSENLATPIDVTPSHDEERTDSNNDPGVRSLVEMVMLSNNITQMRKTTVLSAIAIGLSEHNTNNERASLLSFIQEKKEAITRPEPKYPEPTPSPTQQDASPSNPASSMDTSEGVEDKTQDDQNSDSSTSDTISVTSPFYDTPPEEPDTNTMSVTSPLYDTPPVEPNLDSSDTISISSPLHDTPPEEPDSDSSDTISVSSPLYDTPPIESNLDTMRAASSLYDTPPVDTGDNPQLNDPIYVDINTPPNPPMSTDTADIQDPIESDGSGVIEKPATSTTPRITSYPLEHLKNQLLAHMARYTSKK